MSAPMKRAIDDIQAADSPRDIEVLCLGLSRTGTMTMQTALNKLGYRTYHAVEILKSDNCTDKHIDCWREAFVAKMYGRGKRYGREEFDKLLKNYNAVTDAPCVCFADELLAAYPSAKVILTTRDPDQWLQSMDRAYYRVLSHPDFKWFRALGALDPDTLGPYLDWLRFPLRYWTHDDWEDRDALKRAFVEHNAHIRDVVPEGRRLEFELRDGWGPLCGFLGKAVPDEAFPHVNEGLNAANLHIRVGWIRAGVVFGGYLMWPVVAGLSWGWELGWGRWVG